MNQDRSQEIRELYLNYKLLECIEKADELDHSVVFADHQYFQLYKGLSYLELGNIQIGFDTFTILFKEIDQRKEKQINQLDVITRVFYHLQLYYYDEYKSEQQNVILQNICEEYKSQNEQSKDYSAEVYLFAKGVYLYISKHKRVLNTESFQYLEEAIKLDSYYKQDIMMFLGWVYYSKRLYQKSLEISEQLYKLNPLYPSVSNNLAIINRKLNNFELVEKFYTEADTVCPNNTVILQNFGYYYVTRNDLEKGQLYYEKAYNVLPRQGKSCLCLGRLFCDKGETEKGYAILREGIEISPNFTGNYEYLASKLMETDPDEAHQLIKKCVQLHPQDGYYLLAQGDVLLANYNLESALQSYQKGLTMENSDDINFSLHLNLSACFQEYEEWDMVFKHLFQAGNCYIESNRNQDVGYLCELVNGSEYKHTKMLIKLVSNQFGHIQSRLSLYIKQIENPLVQAIFTMKLDMYRTTLEIVAQQKQIQEQLLFKSQYSHLDLYID